MGSAFLPITSSHAVDSAWAKSVAHPTNIIADVSPAFRAAGLNPINTLRAE
jgi:hypothetical protein